MLLFATARPIPTPVKRCRLAYKQSMLLFATARRLFWRPGEETALQAIDASVCYCKWKIASVSASYKQSMLLFATARPFCRRSLPLTGLQAIDASVCYCKKRSRQARSCTTPYKQSMLLFATARDGRYRRDQATVLQAIDASVCYCKQATAATPELVEPTSNRCFCLLLQACRDVWLHHFDVLQAIDASVCYCKGYLFKFLQKKVLHDVNRARMLLFSKIGPTSNRCFCLLLQGDSSRCEHRHDGSYLQAKIRIARKKMIAGLTVHYWGSKSASFGSCRNPRTIIMSKIELH